jgi:hypothetical protein
MQAVVGGITNAIYRVECEHHPMVLVRIFGGEGT